MTIEGSNTEETGEIQRAIAQVGRLQRIAGAALAVAVAALALAAVAVSRSVHIELPTPGPATLEASEVTVRDPQGNVRGRWTLHGLSLADESGRMRAGLHVSDQGAPTLTLFSANGGIRAVLGLGSEDSPALTLHDERNRVRTRIVVGADDAPSVVISNAQGDVTARVPAPSATSVLKAPRRGR